MTKIPVVYMTSANRGTSGTWAYAERALEHLGQRNSPLDQAGFEAPGGIPLNPKRATLSSKSLTPSRDWGSTFGEACRR